MTFVEFKMYTDGIFDYRQKRDAWLAWHTGALSQMGKKMPPFNRFIPKKREEQLSYNIYSKLRQHNARLRAKDMG